MSETMDTFIEWGMVLAPSEESFWSSHGETLWP